MLWFLRAVSARLRGWKLYLVVIAVIFFAVWVAMAAFEPPESVIAEPDNYWWWFVVTAFTVGYGDVFPLSVGGRIGASMVMATAIGVVAALVGDVVERAASRKSRRLKGLTRVDTEKHFVIVGYTAGRTERIVHELCADPTAHVVLCAAPEQAAEHPMPERLQVTFVRGEGTDVATLDRAAVSAARAVIVDAPEGDDRAALTALVVHRVAPDPHIVVAVRDLDRMVGLLGQFGTAFEYAEWYDVRMLSEAAQDPGITRFHSDLKSRGGSDTHSLRLPDSLAGHALREVMLPLKEQLNVTVCALGAGERFINNPPLDLTLTAGMVLYYIADRRLTAKDVSAVVPGVTSRG